MAKEQIEVSVEVDSDIEKVWEIWVSPKHIEKWNQASEDWLTVNAKSDLKEGGKFSYRMEAKDKSAGFDFEGEFTKIEQNKLIEYKLADDREVSVIFEDNDGKTKVVEKFDPEEMNSAEMQKSGWQAILDNFKKYAERDQ